MDGWMGGWMDGWMVGVEYLIAVKLAVGKVVCWLISCQVEFPDSLSVGSSVG